MSQTQIKRDITGNIYDHWFSFSASFHKNPVSIQQIMVELFVMIQSIKKSSTMTQNWHNISDRKKRRDMVKQM
jgi:hypothetical protein